MKGKFDIRDTSFVGAISSAYESSSAPRSCYASYKRGATSIYMYAYTYGLVYIKI